MKAKKTILEIRLSKAEQLQRRLAEGGVAPSTFSRTPRAAVHRDKKKELKLGKSKHRATYA